jgi:uroporphyrinogen III methyltransferase/synthase
MAMVYLVGAGPGDPGLLTMRAAELLARAEVVIYDGLVNPQLLRRARPGAEIIYGGKHDRTRAVSQDELNGLLLAKAREGKCVVRLKGGDPYVLGRGGEEALLLAEQGIPFEVVPGVSSVEGVTCYAGIPLTHRQFCAGYSVVTGHDANTSPNHAADWRPIAQTPGTLVILMGLANLRAIAEALVSGGRGPDTPAAVISWGTMPRQKTVVGTLADIVQRTTDAAIKPPAITVVGEVVRLREKLNWFERRPLFGQRVVVTQRSDLAQPRYAALRESGAEVLEIPATRFRPPKDSGPLKRVLAELKRYDWIVFSNPIGVEVFFCFFFKRYKDLRELGRARLGACGPMTADKLRAWHLEPVAVAADHRTSLIVEALVQAGGVAGQKVLLLRGEDTLATLPATLTEMGAKVDDVACLGTEPESEDRSGDAAHFMESGAEWVVFASGLAIEHFHQRFDLPGLLSRFPQMKLALASPTIRSAIEKLGLKATVVAEPNDVEGLHHLMGSSRGRRAPLSG